MPAEVNYLLLPNIAFNNNWKPGKILHNVKCSRELEISMIFQWRNFNVEFVHKPLEGTYGTTKCGLKPALSTRYSDRCPTLSQKCTAMEKKKHGSCSITSHYDVYSVKYRKGNGTVYSICCKRIHTKCKDNPGCWKSIRKRSRIDQSIQVRRWLDEGDWGKTTAHYTTVQNELSRLVNLVLRGTRLVIPKEKRVKSIGLAQRGHQGTGYVTTHHRTPAYA